MNKTAIFYIISIAFLIFIASCSSFKFSKTGVFVNDVDEYFNPALKMNVWTYMNFYPSREGDTIGVRITDFYETDLEVLKKLGIKSKGANVLFSAVPRTKPHYNLMAILHQKRLPKTAGFKKKDVDKNQFYLQKDFELGRLDIRHILIPFEDNKKMLSLVYYINKEEHQNCPYCKLDYLAKINTINLQDSKQRKYRANWVVAENITDDAVDTEFVFPTIIHEVKGKVYLKIFAEYESQNGINYFHILDSKQKEEKIKVKLLPNRYFLEYQDEQFRTVYRDTIQVKS